MSDDITPNAEESLQITVSQYMDDLTRAEDMSAQVDRLKERAVGLEVDCIAAASAKRFKKSEAAPDIPVETAAAIVLTLDRRQVLSQRLSEVTPDERAHDGLLDSGRDALEAWLNADELTEAKKFSSTVRGVLMLVCFGAVIAGVMVHWAFFILLMPVGATSALMWSGNDSHWKRLGAKNRYLATGLEPPLEWNAGPVAERLDAVCAQLEAARTLDRAEIPPEQIEALEHDIGVLDEELDLVLASVGLERDELDPITERGLRAFSAAFIARQDLSRVQSEIRRLEGEVETIRNRVYRFLFRYREAPPKGSADLPQLMSGLQRVALTLDANS